MHTVPMNNLPIIAVEGYSDLQIIHRVLFNQGLRKRFTLIQCNGRDGVIAAVDDFSWNRGARCLGIIDRDNDAKRLYRSTVGSILRTDLRDLDAMALQSEGGNRFLFTLFGKEAEAVLSDLLTHVSLIGILREINSDQKHKLNFRQNPVQKFFSIKGGRVRFDFHDYVKAIAKKDSIADADSLRDSCLSVWGTTTLENRWRYICGHDAHDYLAAASAAFHDSNAQSSRAIGSRLRYSYTVEDFLTTQLGAQMQDWINGG